MDQNIKCVLAEQVLSKLDKDGISKPLSKELIKSKEYLKEAVEKNYKNYIILEHAVKFLQHKAINSFPHTFSQKDSKVNKEEINKFLEESIERFCKKIVYITGNTYAYQYQRNSKRAFRESIKQLLSECDMQTTQSKEIQYDLSTKENITSIYYKDLVEGISLLKSLISLYEKKLKFEFLIKELYAKKWSTLSLKIKRFESQIMKATYNEKSVEALKVISDELDEQKENLEENLHNAEADLCAYDALGSEYEELVKEYSELTNKILEEQWAITSLMK